MPSLLRFLFGRDGRTQPVRTPDEQKDFVHFVGGALRTDPTDMRIGLTLPGRDDDTVIDYPGMTTQAWWAKADDARHHHPEAAELAAHYAPPQAEDWGTFYGDPADWDVPIVENHDTPLLQRLERVHHKLGLPDETPVTEITLLHQIEAFLMVEPAARTNEQRVRMIESMVR